MKSLSQSTFKSAETDTQSARLRPLIEFSRIKPAISLPFPTPVPSPMKNPRLSFSGPGRKSSCYCVRPSHCVRKYLTVGEKFRCASKCKKRAVVGVSTWVQPSRTHSTWTWVSFPSVKIGEGILSLYRVSGEETESKLAVSQTGRGFRVEGFATSA